LFEREKISFTISKALKTGLRGEGPPFRKGKRRPFKEGHQTFLMYEREDEKGNRGLGQKKKGRASPRQKKWEYLWQKRKP